MKFMSASDTIKRGTPRKASARTSHVLRDQLFVLAARDIKIKHKQSAMGLLWATLMPDIIVGAGMLIRIAMAKMSDTALSSDSLLSITVKALPWAFFVSGIRFAINSLTSNDNLVTKINYPRIAFPVYTTGRTSMTNVCGAHGLFAAQNRAKVVIAPFPLEWDSSFLVPDTRRLELW